jgi:CMP-N-acetylneuraminic acid synthetase
MRFICLIPARANSKRLKNKNFLNFKGKRLIEWTLLFSKKIKLFKKIILSTDNQKIFELKKKYPKITFIRRPKKISKSNTPMSSVVKHTIDYLKTDVRFYDAIVVLQPTSPLRKLITINKAILKFKKYSPDYLASVTLAKHNQSPNMAIIKKNKNFFQKKNIDINTDRYKKYYYLDGGVIFIFNVSNKKFKFKGKGMFVEVNFPENIDIDTLSDFNLAKKYFNGTY